MTVARDHDFSNRHPDFGFQGRIFHVKMYKINNHLID